MPDPKNIQLQRYADGTPSVMRKKTVYTDLFFYQKSDVLVQLTKAFCERFLPKYGDRTVDQMVQAARSVKQNIAEGLTDGQTSFEVEMKLLGIAKGSNQELLEDYMDYLKHNRLSLWTSASGNSSGSGASSASSNSSTSSTSSSSRDSSSYSASINSSASSNSRDSINSTYSKDAANHVRYDKMLAFCRSNNDLRAYQPFFYRWTDEEMCNTAICLCHMVDKMMTTFLEKRDNEFVTEGGIRERMTAARLDMRGTQKQIIAQQAAEIQRLKAQVASLQRELEAVSGRVPPL